jgi:hypothetical protein
LTSTKSIFGRWPEGIKRNYLLPGDLVQ